jgi:hypothetical protein
MSFPDAVALRDRSRKVAQCLVIRMNHPPDICRMGGWLETLKRVKGEGEEAFPISLSYINLNSSCI